MSNSNVEIHGSNFGNIAGGNLYCFQQLPSHWISLISDQIQKVYDNLGNVKMYCDLLEKSDSKEPQKFKTHLENFQTNFYNFLALLHSLYTSFERPDSPIESTNDLVRGLFCFYKNLQKTCLNVVSAAENYINNSSDNTLLKLELDKLSQLCSLINETTLNLSIMCKEYNGRTC